MMIRKADQAEYPQVLEFYYAISESMVDSPFRPTWRRGIYPVINDLAGELFIATEDSEGIISAILVNARQGTGYENGLWQLTTDHVAVIHLLAVSPNHQHKGVARALLSFARDSAWENADVIRLDTLANNLPAKRLYESFGFQVCGDMDVDCEGVGVKRFTLYEYIF